MSRYDQPSQRPDETLGLEQLPMTRHPLDETRSHLVDASNAIQAWTGEVGPLGNLADQIDRMIDEMLTLIDQRRDRDLAEVNGEDR